MMVLIKLLLAHVLGDFFLQPQKWVEEKEEKKLKSTRFYIHIIIHLILMCILLWDMSLWPLILTIAVLHFLIDTSKLVFQKEKTKRIWFFLDQALHVISIVGAYILYIEKPISFDGIFTQHHILLVLCVIFLTQPVSIIMKNVFLKWDIKTLTEGNESLEDAGQYIGILERILVFVFIIFDHWEAVGFLVTAKSVFRFGDLKESKQRKLTEYVLIGTLISFGIAILTGLLFLFLQ